MLFRKEALDAQKARLNGDVLVTAPIALSAFVTFFVILAIGFLLFLRYASFTRYSSVPGQVVPETGLVKIYAGQTGVIVGKYVSDGEYVKKGKLLYAISDNRHTDQSGDLQADITATILARVDRLHSELSDTQQLELQEVDAARLCVENAKSEKYLLQQQDTLQVGRVRLADKEAARYRELAEKQYVSNEEVDQKESAYLDEKQKSASLKRQIIDATMVVDAKRAEVSSLSLKYSLALSSIYREINRTNEELLISKHLQNNLLVAPRDGTISGSTSLVNIGQTVDSSSFLTNIIPSNSPLVVQVFAKSRDIGLVKVADRVTLHFDAFPYQKYGSEEGVILSIAKVTGLPVEVSGGSSALQLPNEPGYKVIVSLKGDHISLNNVSYPLRSGMTLEAQLARDRRPLYQWVFEPFFAIQN